MSLARAISFESSVWTEMRRLPALTLPSYRLASISGMPRPINPPAIPPTAAPTAAPLNAATIGPAAMKGPTPGMANAPIPAIHPDAPCARTGDRAFRGFRVLFMSEIPSRPLVGEQHGDVVVGEARGFELIDNLIGLPARGGDTEYRFL